MVLRERIELSTSPLPMECSTTELPQLIAARRIVSARDGGLLPHAPPPDKRVGAKWRNG
jgi:hypothetical protein